MLLKSTCSMRHSNVSLCLLAAAVKIGVKKLESSAEKLALLKNDKKITRMSSNQY